MIGAVRAPSGAPRAAVQIDRADLEDFQRAARTLLAHPLVTDRWPTPGALALVRRWELPLANEMSRVLGYRLDVGRTCARLYRRSARLSPHRAATVAKGRPLGRWACSLLCLVLAAFESLGEQATLSGLAAEVLRLRSGDDELPLDLTQYDQRRALVDAVRWLEERGVMTLRDGGAERWLADAEEGDALYDLDRDAASRLLVTSPSVLRDVTDASDFLVDDARPTSAEGEQARLRHRLARRLVEDPVVLYADLPPDELAHVRQRRSRVTDAVELLTGCIVEARAEGLVLVDTPVAPLSAEPFPAKGTEAHAALLWGTSLVALAAIDDERTGLDRAGRVGASTDGRSDADAVDDPGGASVAGGPPLPGLPPPRTVAPAPPPGRPVRAAAAADAWARVVEQYGERFSMEHRGDTDRLRRLAAALLERFGLLTTTAEGDVVVHAPLARYRPEVHLPASPQLSLLDGDPA